MAKATKQDQLDFEEQKELIRAAWNKGKRQVVINGRVFNIRKDTRRSSEHGIENWLIVTPVDPHSTIPMFNIELKPLANIRSVKP